MTIFEDFLSKGNLYQRLKKESLICKAFQETHIKTLYEYGWYDELFDSGEPNFKELEQLPIYVVLIDEYKTEIIQNLIEEYKPLTKIKENGHFFDFLVINAELKLICGLGLGRKNRFFSYISQDDSDFKDNDEEKEELLNASMPWKFLTEFKFTLKQMSLEMFEKDHLPSNPDMLQDALDSGPNENDYFLVEYDDEEYTKDEINTYIHEHQTRQENIEYFGMLLKEMFPSLEISELNTGDY
jgi:hypothetical protein